MESVPVICVGGWENMNQTRPYQQQTATTDRMCSNIAQQEDIRVVSVDLRTGVTLISGTCGFIR